MMDLDEYIECVADYLADRGWIENTLNSEAFRLACRQAYRRKQTWASFAVAIEDSAS